MAKRVWYVGHGTSKVLSNDHWKQRVGKDLPALTFDSSTGFSADVDNLDPDQLKWFQGRNDFYIVDVDTARTDDALLPISGTTTGGGDGGGGGTTDPVPASGGIVISDAVLVSAEAPVGPTATDSVGATAGVTVTTTITPVVTG